MVNASNRLLCTTCVAQNVCLHIKVASVFKLRVRGSNFKLDYVLTFSMTHTYTALFKKWGPICTSYTHTVKIAYL